MSLQEEIDKAIRQIQKESFAMSFGELISMYRNGELVISPTFQRLFRWTLTQKSRFIESLLIGLPIPSIFVSETGEAQWEVVDGLQRLSTVLEFTGDLIDPDTNLPRPPSQLGKTEYLPSLDGATWDTLSKSQQFSLKRSKVNIEVLRRLTDLRSKYDLFMRINSGSPANRQELRNCIMAAVKPEFQEIIDTVADDSIVQSLLQPSEEQAKRLSGQEKICRLVVFGMTEYDGRRELEDYVDEEIKEIALANHHHPEIARKLLDTFRLIDDAVGTDGLKKKEGDRFTGQVGNTAFEIIAVGIFANYDDIVALADTDAFVAGKIEELWSEQIPQTLRRPGQRGTVRIKQTIPFGKRFFRP